MSDGGPARKLKDSKSKLCRTFHTHIPSYVGYPTGGSSHRREPQHVILMVVPSVAWVQGGSDAESRVGQ